MIPQHVSTRLQIELTFEEAVSLHFALMVAGSRLYEEGKPVEAGRIKELKNSFMSQYLAWVTPA